MDLSYREAAASAAVGNFPHQSEDHEDWRRRLAALGGKDWDVLDVKQAGVQGWFDMLDRSGMEVKPEQRTNDLKEFWKSHC